MADGGDFPRMETFTPGADTARLFRDALGQFATGVTVVTCNCPQGPVGITANSFASVSLDPPLVLWSPARASKRFPHFEAADYYAIHVLEAAQLSLCEAFSRNGTGFEGISWQKSEDGVPLIDNCLARFECQLEATHDGGDHLIVVGRVLRAAFGAGAPLVFSAGSYGRFTDAA